MPSPPYKKHIAFSVTNCICFDQRVLKIAGTLSSPGCEITIIGRKLGRCCDEDIIPFRTKRFRMIFRRTFLFYKFYNIRLFFYLLFRKFDILVANDLDTLPANYLASKLKKVPLIYDSHEYFTGLPELNGRSFVRGVWKTIEKEIIPHLNHVMTVSDSVAKQYELEYRIRSSVIRNCSEKSSTLLSYSRQELKIKDEDLLLIYQGGGINIDKGGEELIEAIAMTERVSLLVAGSGDVVPRLKERTEELHLAGKIRFLPGMPWNELMRYTRSADAGLCLEKDTNLNYRFSLPNKLFEYISAGIPVITSGLPEVRKIIEQYDCGILIPAVTPEEIRNAVIKIRDDRDLLNKLRKNSVSASEILNWRNESEKVKEFYKPILKDI